MKNFLMLMIVFLAACSLAAQEDTKKKQEAPDRDAIVKKAAVPTYKMAFSIYELQDGKKINQRDYSLLVEANERGANTLKIGTKVPIDTGKESYTYTDVGFELRCSAGETVNNKLEVSVDIGISNFAIPEQNTAPRAGESRPVLRAVTQRVSAVVNPGKPQILTSMDDVNSTKRIQVELTATKVD
ncbi:MAG TPA: hypothetical protein VIJ01_14415 [Candidatus Angelobacter sp.]